MRTGEYKDGAKDGPWASYYANGQLMSEGCYEAGIKVGRWLQYWQNGQLKSDATFFEGKYIGHYICWHDNGVKQWEGYYNKIRGNSADGTKEGVWLSYDKATGEVWRVITYHHGGRTKEDLYAPFAEPPVMGPEPK